MMGNSKKQGEVFSLDNKQSISSSKEYSSEQDRHDRIIVAINAHIPQLIDDFVEDYSKDRPTLVNLIITLKYWANPKGGYSRALDNKIIENDFEYIESTLKNPKSLLLMEQHFTKEDEKFILDLLKIRLNEIANKYIEKYHLEDDVNKQINISKSKAEIWWNEKTPEQKREIERSYNGLTNEQHREINKHCQSIQKIEQKANNNQYTQKNDGYHKNAEVHTTQNYYNITHQNSNSQIDPLLLFVMCNHSAELSMLMLNATLRAALFTGHIITCGVKGSLNGIKDITSGMSKVDSKTVAGIVAACAFIGIAAAGIVGAVYAIPKFCKSVFNLLSASKPWRSIFRIGSIGGGGYGGGIGGGMIGAALGSFIPGLGTAAGFILGTIFGAGIGAGIAAFSSKQIARKVSAAFHPNELNPTNPEKYKLSPKQIENLKKNGHNITIINQMIAIIKNEKSQLAMCEKNYFSERSEMNQKLKLIKEGKFAGAVTFKNITLNSKLNVMGKPHLADKDYDEFKKLQGNRYKNSNSQIYKLGLMPESSELASPQINSSSVDEKIMPPRVQPEPSAPVFQSHMLQSPSEPYAGYYFNSLGSNQDSQDSKETPEPSAPYLPESQQYAWAGGNRRS